VDGEEQLGVNLIKRAFEEPVRQMAGNAGFEGSVVVRKIMEGEGNFGFNAEMGEYEDLLKAGIIPLVIIFSMTGLFLMGITSLVAAA